MAYEILAPPQQRRLEQFGVPRCVDLHCHCLPGLDDGPQTWDAAVSLCRALVADGVTTAIATPHQLGRYDRSNAASKIRETVEALSAKLDAEEIPLEVLPGADVRVDECLLSLFDLGEVMTVADQGKYLLIELPHELFLNPKVLLDGLMQRGIRPILTHPERYRYLHDSMDVIDTWVEQGVAIQVTAGSFLGDFGSSARQMAWELARRGVVELVATDAHDAKQRCPRLSDAIEILSMEFGVAFAKQVCLVNPLAVVEGKEIR